MWSKRFLFSEASLEVKYASEGRLLLAQACKRKLNIMLSFAFFAWFFVRVTKFVAFQMRALHVAPRRTTKPEINTRNVVSFFKSVETLEAFEMGYCACVTCEN